ncbi:hypothetical protein Poly51_63350 [Rubripirellula tenax]|uniref:Uncharacterized protein n=1 Tax=Rubripirellula tenax TaxID=2528015 RepID=A0A5C6E6G7_9BACT|nr:hypothetical protein Poly51_63350 [Rubripirellula tenax]
MSLPFEPKSTFIVESECTSQPNAIATTAINSRRQRSENFNSGNLQLSVITARISGPGRLMLHL